LGYHKYILIRNSYLLFQGLAISPEKLKNNKESDQGKDNSNKIKLFSAYFFYLEKEKSHAQKLIGRIPDYAARFWYGIRNKNNPKISYRPNQNLQELYMPDGNFLPPFLARTQYYQ